MVATMAPSNGGNNNYLKYECLIYWYARAVYNIDPHETYWF